MRNFRQGDCFKPLGWTGHKKIKDLFIDNKVALSVRAKLPFLLVGQDSLGAWPRPQQDRPGDPDS